MGITGGGDKPAAGTSKPFTAMVSGQRAFVSPCSADYRLNPLNCCGLCRLVAVSVVLAADAPVLQTP